MHAAVIKPQAKSWSFAARPVEISANVPSNGVCAMNTVNSVEIGRYNALAQRWWDETGVRWPLHKPNALRVPYICEQIAGLGMADGKSLAGLRVLDIGCGAGLLAESIAKRGAQVVAIDPAAKNIAVAKDHARQQGFDIDYRVGTLDQSVGD
jgi:2-polyprenyl-6-hydroxyphenyl methylase/3-demethylubiquinone-9 3-methyltransferase